MEKEFIDYSALVDDAMHLIVKKSLQIFAKNVVNTNHHFFISFITKYPGVTLSDKLRVKYPYEMTIVLQYQFEDLLVSDNHFEVSLSFDGKKEKITIPFAALTAFADPSVKFGLQFRHIEEEQANESEYDSFQTFSANNVYDATHKNTHVNSDESHTKSNVISLDFKNKKLK